MKPWPWHYWWQAHLLDCLVDAQLRAPRPGRADTIAAVARTVRLRNLGSWTNDYYDDVAWFGLAVQRAGTLARRSARPALGAITLQLRDGWSADCGGGIWWRRGDDFKNAPANGPAAILLARGGHVGLAASIVDWMHDTLLDPATGLIRDGVRGGPDGAVRAVEGTVYTYCQGVHLGACVALADVDGDARWAARAAALMDAIGTHVVGPDGVVPGYDDGGDGGCSTGSWPAIWPTPRSAARSSPPRPRGSCSRAPRRRGRAGWNSAGGRCSPRTGAARPAPAPRARRGGPVRAALGVDAAGGRGGGAARRLTVRRDP